MVGRIARVFAVAFVLAPVLGAGPGRRAAFAGPALDEHTVELAASVEVAVGETTAVSLTLTPRPGFRISTAGPIRIALSVAPTSGAALLRRRLQRADAADPRAEAPRFDIGIRGDAAGDYAVAVDARFWVCGRYTCRPIHATRVVAVRVVAPAAGA
jgi:hypothetical protein